MTKTTEVQTSLTDLPEAQRAFTVAEQIKGIFDDQLAIEGLQAQLIKRVEAARNAGATWEQIGLAMGLTRSAVQKYYGRLINLIE
jgi:hypothetical protein